MIDWKEVGWVIASVVAIIAAACQAPAAEGAYEAQQLACVEKGATRAEVDACRAKVREAWGRADAGGE